MIKQSETSEVTLLLFKFRINPRPSLKIIKKGLTNLLQVNESQPTDYSWSVYQGFSKIFLIFFSHLSSLLTFRMVNYS